MPLNNFSLIAPGGVGLGAGANPTEAGKTEIAKMLQTSAETR
jgi:hypothetical protein